MNQLLARFSLVALSWLLLPLGNAQGLPDGAGKDIVARVCSGCHGLGQVTRQKRSANAWKDLVAQMVDNGAKATPEELASIVAYLSKNFAGQEAPAGPQPSSLTLEKARDLSGVWMEGYWYMGLNMGPRDNLPNNSPLRGVHDPSKSLKSLFTPWAQEAAKQFTIYNDPINRCASPGPQAYSAPYAFEFLQTPGRVTMLMEYFHEVRRIWLDGRGHPKDLEPSYLGHSIGNWEGDTLVVDTVGFQEDKAWRTPHSDQLHQIERIRRVLNGNVLEIELTVEDPKALQQPVRSYSYFKKDPTLEIQPYACTDPIDYSNHAPRPAK